MSRGPRQEHDAEPLGIFEEQMCAVFHIVIAMAQQASPRAHARRHARGIEHLVDQVRAVIEENAAARIGAQSAPRRWIRAGAAVSHQAVHVQLSEVPAPDGALREPLPQLYPHGVVAILMAGHHDASGGARRIGDTARFLRRERHGLLAQHVVALLECPEREIEVRRRRRTDVDEIDVGNRAQRFARSELRHAIQWDDRRRPIHRRHDFEAIARGRVVHEARNVRPARHAAETDHRAAIFPRARGCGSRAPTWRRGRCCVLVHRASESAVSRRMSSVIASASIASSSVITSGGLMRTSGL